MPTYEYACKGCGHEWEEMQKISEPPLEECPKCKNKTAQRQVSAGNFILKGGGWYSDLYSSPKPSSEKSESKGASESKGETKTDGAKSESTSGSSAGSSATSSPSTSSPASGGEKK